MEQRIIQTLNPAYNKQFQESKYKNIFDNIGKRKTKMVKKKVPVGKEFNIRKESLSCEPLAYVGHIGELKILMYNL